eukprot:3940723-Rhodomonas_salina.3
MVPTAPASTNPVLWCYSPAGTNSALWSVGEPEVRAQGFAVALGRDAGTRIGLCFAYGMSCTDIQCLYIEIRFAYGMSGTDIACREWYGARRRETRSR